MSLDFNPLQPLASSEGQTLPPDTIAHNKQLAAYTLEVIQNFNNKVQALSSEKSVNDKTTKETELDKIVNKIYHKVNSNTQMTKADVKHFLREAEEAGTHILQKVPKLTNTAKRVCEDKMRSAESEVKTFLAVKDGRQEVAATKSRLLKTIALLVSQEILSKNEAQELTRKVEKEANAIDAQIESSSTKLGKLMRPPTEAELRHIRSHPEIAALAITITQEIHKKKLPTSSDQISELLIPLAPGVDKEFEVVFKAGLGEEKWPENSQSQFFHAVEKIYKQLLKEEVLSFASTIDELEEVTQTREEHLVEQFLKGLDHLLMHEIPDYDYRDATKLLLNDMIVKLIDFWKQENKELIERDIQPKGGQPMASSLGPIKGAGTPENSFFAGIERQNSQLANYALSVIKNFSDKMKDSTPSDYKGYLFKEFGSSLDQINRQVHHLQEEANKAGKVLDPTALGDLIHDIADAGTNFQHNYLTGASENADALLNKAKVEIDNAELVKQLHEQLKIFALAIGSQLKNAAPDKAEKMVENLDNNLNKIGLQIDKLLEKQGEKGALAKSDFEELVGQAVDHGAKQLKEVMDDSSSRAMATKTMISAKKGIENLFSTTQKVVVQARKEFQIPSKTTTPHPSATPSPLMSPLPSPRTSPISSRANTPEPGESEGPTDEVARELFAEVSLDKSSLKKIVTALDNLHGSAKEGRAKDTEIDQFMTQISSVVKKFFPIPETVTNQKGKMIGTNEMRNHLRQQVDILYDQWRGTATKRSSSPEPGESRGPTEDIVKEMFSGVELDKNSLKKMIEAIDHAHSIAKQEKAENKTTAYNRNKRAAIEHFMTQVSGVVKKFFPIPETVTNNKGETLIGTNEIRELIRNQMDGLYDQWTGLNEGFNAEVRNSLPTFFSDLQTPLDPEVRQAVIHSLERVFTGVEKDLDQHNKSGIPIDLKSTEYVETKKSRIDRFMKEMESVINILFTSSASRVRVSSQLRELVDSFYDRWSGLKR